MVIHVHMKSAEVKLMEMLNAITQPAGWTALHFNLADLMDEYKSEYQLKIAINLIHDLLKNFDAGIFLLVDNSIIVVCYGLEKTLQNKLIFQLRYLYMDDPLAYTEDGHENPEFCTAYDLSRSWQAFFDVSSQRMAFSMRRSIPGDRGARKPPKLPPEAAAAVAESPKPAAANKLGAFSASRLATIEEDLRHADLSRVIRRQPVCAMTPGAPAHRVFDELYIHIAHLRQMLKAEIDFFSNRWLFKYLTQILDERMIEMIRHNPSRYFDSPISLNLNVETLLSSSFAEFDAMVKPATKVSIVIEVPVIDVFSDIAGFMLAKEEVQKLGYRVCLDGLTVKSFININREKLGLDLIKVQWNADAASDIRTRENSELAKAVQDTGSNRVILCRCDNLAAVEYGQAMGVSLFQGRHVDLVLDPSTKVQN